MPKTSHHKDDAHDVAAARHAGLHYVHDDKPGIQRLRAGKGFRYVGPNGKTLKDPAVLKRIHSLVLPPAWEKVWICADAHGHIQATGLDARGRKQYRYHADWRQSRDETKFHRMIAFGKMLPKIRRRVQRDLHRPGLEREKVLATIVRLMDLSAIRVGNEEYAHENKSYGLTTLQHRHVDVSGSEIHFHFRGKSGVHHHLSVDNPLLAKVVKLCQHLPEQELFAWVDKNGIAHDVTSTDVNEYLQEISGHEFSSKDFRTWTGTVFAALELCHSDKAKKTGKKSRVVDAIKQVAQRLGNTPSVCKKCYIHPAIFDSFQDDTLSVTLKSVLGNHGSLLRVEEAGVLVVLRRNWIHHKKPLQTRLHESLLAVKARSKT